MNLNFKSQISSKVIYFGENLDFKRISKVLGKKPSHTERKGNSINKVAKVKQDYWQYESPFSDSIDIKEHINAVLNSISLSKELEKLNESLEVYLYIKILLGEETPIMDIDPTTIGTLSKYNFHLDIDMYFNEI